MSDRTAPTLASGINVAILKIKMILTFGAFCSLFVTLGAVVLAGTAFVGAVRLFPALKKREPAFLLVLNFLGPLAWWLLVARRPEISDPLAWGGVALLSAGQLAYLDLRSLLSRGYSARILVDLKERGGRAPAHELERAYGDGKGVEGLLDRRLEGLGHLRLYDVARARLTVLGELLGHLFDRLRRLWGFREVG